MRGIRIALALVAIGFNGSVSISLNADDDPLRTALTKWYGRARADATTHAEVFETCEYGRQPDDDDVRECFPMLPQ